MTKVYIIEFSTGEYEDQTEYIYKAFFDKEKAKEECDRLNKVLVDYDLHTSSSFVRVDNLPKLKIETDIQNDIDYTGADFSLYDIDVE